MALTTLTYILFLILCVFLYYIVPPKARNTILLAGSLAFYAYAMPAQLCGMLLYVWAIHILSLRMVKRRKHPSKPLLIVGIVISLAYLFFYKYLNFTLSIFTHKPRTLSLIVPIGISYVTFRGIWYMHSVYKKRMPAVKDPVLFFLYCLFFAKITAGPIEAPETFFPQFRTAKGFRMKRILSAIVLISVGFAKKIAVADLCAPAVAAVFDSKTAVDGLSSLSAIFLYAIQIYFDFSGYTDIALGSARLFGIELTENFDHPYRAVSIVDFWKRWHISLTGWLRNNIYFPLGGSRVSIWKRYRNIMIVFLVSGIWHGASFTYIFWGLLHGILQCMEIMFAKPSANKSLKSPILQIIAQVRTFLLVCAAWVFFRASSIADAFRVLGSVFTKWVAVPTVMTGLGLSIGTLLLMITTMLISDPVKKLCVGEALTEKKTILLSGFMFTIVLLALVLSSGSSISNSFIYFDF